MAVNPDVHQNLLGIFFFSQYWCQSLIPYQPIKSNSQVGSRHEHCEHFPQVPLINPSEKEPSILQKPTVTPHLVTESQTEEGSSWQAWRYSPRRLPAQVARLASLLSLLRPLYRNAWPYWEGGRRGLSQRNQEAGPGQRSASHGARPGGALRRHHLPSPAPPRPSLPCLLHITNSASPGRHVWFQLRRTHVPPGPVPDAMHTPSQPSGGPKPSRNTLVLSWWGLWSSGIPPLGPALAMGRGSGQRRSPGFYSVRDEEEERETLRRHSLNSWFPNSPKQEAQTCYFFSFWVLFSLYLTQGQPLPTHTPFTTSGLETLSSRVGKGSQSVLPGGLVASEEKGS